MKPKIIPIAKGSFAVFSILFCLSCGLNDSKKEQTKSNPFATATNPQNNTQTLHGDVQNKDTTLTVHTEIASAAQPKSLGSSPTKSTSSPLSKKKIGAPKVSDSLPTFVPVRSIFDPEKKNIDGYTPKNDN